MANKYHNAEKAAKEINDLKIKNVSAEVVTVIKDPFTAKEKAKIKKAREQLK